jgi:hypothetical protein
LPGASGFVRENAFLSRLFVTERRRVVVELTEVVKHERVTGVSTTLATAACLADPLVPHLLQCVAAEDALVAALLVSEPRIRRVLEAASCSDRNVRAMGVPCSSASHFRTSLTSSWSGRRWRGGCEIGAPAGCPPSRAARSSALSVTRSDGGGRAPPGARPRFPPRRQAARQGTVRT